MTATQDQIMVSSFRGGRHKYQLKSFLIELGEGRRDRRRPSSRQVVSGSNPSIRLRAVWIITLRTSPSTTAFVSGLNWIIKKFRVWCEWRSYTPEQEKEIYLRTTRCDVSRTQLVLTTVPLAGSRCGPIERNLNHGKMLSGRGMLWIFGPLHVLFFWCTVLLRQEGSCQNLSDHILGRRTIYKWKWTI